jgi:copper homeostasis protein
MMDYIIEIATVDFETTQSAVHGGADRIELCAALGDGGTTPSFAMIKKCRESFSIPIFPIIRPRGGDFLFSDEEFEIMMHDVLVSKALGCDGVAIGLLKKDGEIDTDRTKRLIAAAYPMEITFHRAFDRCKDPYEALEQLIEMGCHRLLTSGQKLTAPEGIDLLSKLVSQANDRIIIMPGSGVRRENIKDIAMQSGVIEFHSSLRNKTKSKMEFMHSAFTQNEESYYNSAINPDDVKALREALLHK